MKHLLIIAALCAPVPVWAQQNSDIEGGFSLLEEGARLLFRGLMSEVEPAIDDFAGLAELADDLEPALELLATEMGPALMELAQAIDSIRHYSAPEVLPNGDIIIRRNEDAPPFVPEVGENGAVDL